MARASQHPTHTNFGEKFGFDDDRLGREDTFAQNFEVTLRIPNADHTHTTSNQPFGSVEIEDQ